MQYIANTRLSHKFYTFDSLIKIKSVKHFSLQLDNVNWGWFQHSQFVIL